MQLSRYGYQPETAFQLQRDVRVLSYAAARDTLIEQLRADARSHAIEKYDEIGRRFDRIEHQFPTGTAPELSKLHIAFAFRDGWINARNNGWPRGPIAMQDWLALAESVAADLQADRDLSSKVVLSNFMSSPIPT